MSIEIVFAIRDFIKALLDSKERFYEQPPFNLLSTPTQPNATVTASPASKAVRSDLSFFQAFWETLDRSKVLRYILYCIIFLCILFLDYNGVSIRGKLVDNWAAVKTLFIFSLSFYLALIVAFNVLSSKSALTSNRSMCLIWSAILIQLSMVQIISHICVKTEYDTGLLLLLIPYGFAPMITTVLLGRRVGIFTVLSCALFGSVLVPTEFFTEVLAISLIAGSVTILSTKRARMRSQLLKAGCYTGLTVLIMCLMFGRIEFAGWEMDQLQKMGLHALLAFSVSLFVAIFLGGVFPILESIFGIITPTSWFELSDMNHSLLKRMQLEAPGTFHHSLAVAQLAETAAAAIGANALQCQVCAYFHDLGKLKNPNYFIENINMDDSPHLDLPPLTSAKIIKAHVTDGVELASQAKLNRHIISVIREHHGTSLVYFFYRKALDLRDEMMAKVEKGLMNPEDVDHPRPEDYSYEGPIPQSKEAGIVSLADIVESAARSLKQPTKEDIAELVDRLIRARIVDGQLDDCRLTLGELKIIRNKFVNSLINMMHNRISYPKPEEEKKPPQESIVKKEEPKEPVSEPVENDDKVVEGSSSEENNEEKSSEVTKENV